MSWIELRLDTMNEAVDWVNTLLASIDYPITVHLTPYVPQESDQQVAEAVHSDQTTDLGDRDHWTHTMRLHLPYDSYASARVTEIIALLSSLQRTGLVTELQTTVVEEINPTQVTTLDAHRIGSRFVLLSPSTSYARQQDDIKLELAPSFAFGSGFHPATHLCLQLLERYVTPAMNTLDLGSGSGILSVAMAKLGAQVLALDNDPVAVQATQDAVNRNEVAQQVIVKQGSLGQGSSLGHWMGGKLLASTPTTQPVAEFDLIAANILARIHIALAIDYHRALQHTHRNNGVLITAGYTIDYLDEINNAFSEVGFAEVDRLQQDEWVALAHQLT